MTAKGPGGENREVSGRLWRFAGCEFDESSRVLRRNGQPVELESKPIELLYQLLLHAGEVVTKEELLESVWPGVSVVEGSLATAVSKLRKALEADDPNIIVTIPRVGYRLGVPAQSRRVAAPGSPELGFKPGGAVPGRENWQFVRQMDNSGSSEVWLAGHPKTREQRVFKFAADGVRLKGIKREVTLARFLKESLGERPDFVRVLEWNFDEPPFYLESEYCGQNLAEWAENQGGLERIPFETRLGVLIEAARAVAAAHGIGVLHKDLKPANILMSSKHGGDWQLKVADFGSGALSDPDRLADLGITNLGFTGAVTEREITGTLMYMAPEVLAGQSPTAAADVYALGVLLYQLTTGDFRRPLSPGWEAAVSDPLLREDIADAACGDPARRISSAAVLVERLQNLDRRRVERRELDEAQERAKVAERRLAEARARRPWVAAAVLALAIGLAGALILYQRAARERDRANRQTAIAASINQFLAGDLLGRSDPFQSGQKAETLIDAVKQASPNIDRQFGRVPEVAARLHHAIARALDGRTNYADARHEYETAANLYRKAGGPLSQDAIIADLQRAAMEARTYQQGGLEQAKSILKAQEALIGQIPHPTEDLPVWLASARGMIALIANNAQEAAAQFRLAHDRASTLPDFDETARLTLKQRLAFCYIRLGDGATAERLFRELIAAFTRATGPESPNVLRVRLNLAQAYMIQGKHDASVAETTAIYPMYVARLGEDHELAMQVLSTRAESEGALEHWADAIRDNLKIRELAVRKQGALSFFAIATLSDAALAQCRSGDYREGEPNARRAHEDSVKAFGTNAGLTGGTTETLASCLIGVGKLDEASALLETIDAKAVAQLAGVPDWAAHVELARAAIAWKRGDYDSARQHLVAAAPAFSRAGAEPYLKHQFETLSTNLNKRLAQK
jgi:DNA-binding winged helix-turn-helix (wHTH) protein/serine/threonine protein kinase